MQPRNDNPGKIPTSNESVLLCTLRLILNLLSHVLISVVVLICLLFSCRLVRLTVIELHIVLCVLGYQFFMSQGILVLSTFNSWSKFIKKQHRRNIHWYLELIGAMLIIVGSIEVIDSKKDHFNTTHGILGLCAFFMTMISILNGLATSLATKFAGHSINLTFASKCVHGLTGIGALFFSAASLHFGYDKGSFKKWVESENFILALKIFTWISTLLVSFEFCIVMGKRIKYKYEYSNGNAQLEDK